MKQRITGITILSIILIQAARAQGGPTLVPTDPTASSTIITTQGGDKIVAFAQSQNRVVAVTQQGMVYSNLVTGGTADVRPVQMDLQRTTPVMNFQGAVDCWTGSTDKCVICGIGGCYITTWTGTLMSLQKVYFHKKYYPGATFNYDYVFSVMAIQTTNYFLTVEGFFGTNSGGVMRWNGDGTSANCYARWSPATSGADSTNQRYIMRYLTNTKLVSVVPLSSQQLYLIDITNVATSTTPIVNGKAFGNSVPGFQDYDLISARYDTGVNAIICGNVLTALCYHVLLGTVTAPATKLAPADSVIQQNSNPFRVPTTFTTATQSPVPTTVRVKVFPESQDHFVVSYGKLLLLFAIPGTAPAASNPIDMTMYGQVTTTDYIMMLDDRYYATKFLYGTETMIARTDFSGTTLNAATNCNTGCAQIGTPAAGNFCNKYFRGQDCVGCLTGGTSPKKYIASGLSQGVKCRIDLSTTVEQAKVTGSPNSYNSFPSSLSFITTSDVCTNTTRLNSVGANPNDSLNNTRVAASTSTNLTALWIVLGILGGLLVIGAIAAVALGGKGSKAKRQQQYMMGQQQYMMGQMGGMGGQMGPMGGQMGGMGGQMGGMGPPMGGMVGNGMMGNSFNGNGEMGMEMEMEEVVENSFVDDMSYNGGYNSGMGGGNMGGNMGGGYDDGMGGMGDSPFVG